MDSPFDKNALAMADSIIRLEMKCPYLKLELGWPEVVMMIAHLQLALRHPGNVGPTAAQMRSVIEQIIGAIETYEPPLAVMLRKGFDSACDVERPPAPPEPIPMVLCCPKCGKQHVDAPEPEKGWTNPPHKSHLCHGCGTIWRPADVPTDGVAKVATRGEKDTWPEVVK